MSEFTYKNDDVVRYSYAGMSGVGKVKGVATVQQAVIGSIYIVQTDDVYSNIYPFSSIAVPECNLQKA